MSELALYRKYRSQTFAEVVGQPHIVTTLTNALKNNRVSHAYLLTGPRGVGKTSVARLLARAVNCLNQDPAKRPCGECEICQVPLASNMDIIEIDAASNRRIDEMRDLRDKINLAPAKSRYKVYIIDEVHMLTTEAFNALLKTLEEPPAHAIFVLATTESHKLPETIISRTQRFNFKAISLGDLQSHLAGIADQEKIEILPEALHVIAEASRGSFRDAISLLDQVANTTTPPITDETVRTILGLSDAKAIDKLVLATTKQQPARALAILDELRGQGVGSGQLVLQLINRWRSLMLEATAGSKPTDAIGATIEHMTMPEMAQIINRLAQVLQSPLPDIALETTLVELALPQSAGTQIAAPPATKTNPQPKPTAPTQTPIEKPGVQPQSQNNPGDLWPKALTVIKAKNNSLYALLCSCVVEIGTDQVVLTCRFNFHRDRLQEPKNREIIESALDKVYGKPLRVVAQVEAAKLTSAVSSSEELVSSALEILGGEVVDG